MGSLGHVYCAPSKGRLARCLAVIMFPSSQDTCTLEYPPFEYQFEFGLEVLWLPAWCQGGARHDNDIGV